MKNINKKMKKWKKSIKNKWKNEKVIIMKYLKTPELFRKTHF